VLLGFDLDLRREPGAKQCRPHRLAQAGLGEQEEVIGRTAHDDDWRDHAGLRRQEQRLAGSECDVVREHALQEVLCVGACNANELARPSGHPLRNGFHAH
jgi:hypothetical protein